MSTEVVGIIGVVLVLVLIFNRVWVGAAMAVVGFLGYAYLDGWEKAFHIIGMEPYAQISSYTLTSVPLFILMGAIVSNSGIGMDMYNAANKWIGHFRGGLAMATIIACGGFAAVSGSSVASAVTMGKISYPEMINHKYDSGLAAGAIAAGGTIGILIPPSLGFIMYGILTEQSIGKLFMAGVIPGILQVLFYLGTIYILCRIKPNLGLSAPRAPFKEKVVSLKYTWPIVAIIVLVIGGIYLGVFTPTEAGAVGSFGALIVSILARKFTKESFRGSLVETAQNTSMIVLMIVGAFILMRFLAISKMPFMLSEYIAGLDVSKYWILLGIIILYLILGCFFDILAAQILTLPIIYPTVVAIGFDPIWFGVIMVRLQEIGLISPPFGLNVFVLTKAVNVSTSTAFRGVLPFIVTDFAHLALLIAVPELSLYLANMTAG